MKKFRFSYFLLFIIHIFSVAHAEVRLPAILGNHMILQQNTDEKMWGWCEPGEKIKISSTWDTTTYNTVGNSDGKWMLSIKTPLAGGPYNLTINGNNKIVLEDILVGEVWACSGQSNMEMSYSWGIKQYTEDIENGNNKSIHLFHIPRLTAEYPQDDTKAQWVVCNPDDLKTFSLAGYFFGQKLHETLSVPIGLIESSWGGTPAEVWTPKDAIENNPVLKKVADGLKTTPWGPVHAALTYNAMIYPITNFNIAGVIWYQGEANVANAATYEPLFSTMITSWRKAWQKDFPFYFVQIAPFAGYGKNISGALLQEAQTKTMALPKTGMVVINDLVTDVNNIHPTDKKDVGIRLANYALADTYGKTGFAYKNPEYKDMQIEKSKIKINFENTGAGLVSKNGSPSDFYIAGEDKIFMPATAKIDGNSVIVFNKAIKEPVAVRYGFTNDAMPNLFSKDGLPVNTFRTDDWNDVITLSQK
ncbi:MAG: sialate O-acetylesterase [Bacteroidota bacterium]|nr:sialate O-acetylesterase [Bacteroidota bacterium]